MITVTTSTDRTRDAIDGQPLNVASPEQPMAVHPWIAIAMRPRKSQDGQKLYWQPISGAPVSVEEARSLADAGTLLMASRYHPDRVELVVRPSASAPQ
jgi:hypothetical protein